MDLPAVQLLFLKQKEQSLEDHTRTFLDLGHLTNFPDRLLCVFYYSNLHEWSKVRLREYFAVFVEWVLVNNGSAFTICPGEDNITSPTLDPEPSQPSPHCTDTMPEPTADRGLESATMHEPVPAPEKGTEPTIAPEPEPHRASDKVREPATLCVAVGLLVEFEGMEEDSAHTPTTEGELQLASVNCFYDIEEDARMLKVFCAHDGPILRKVSCSPAGSVQHEVSCVSRVPSQPLSPTSSLKVSQSVSPTSADSLQPLSFSYETTIVYGFASGLQISSFAQACGFPGSTSSRRSHHSTSARRFYLGSPLSQLHQITTVLMAPLGSLVPLTPPWSNVALHVPRTSEPSAAIRLSTSSASSLPRLHCGPLSWLGSGLPSGYSCSCVHPGSPHRHHCPGCFSSHPHLFPAIRRPFVLLTARGCTFREGGATYAASVRVALQVLAGLEHAECDAVEQNHQHADSLKPRRASVKANTTHKNSINMIRPLLFPQVSVLPKPFWNSSRLPSHYNWDSVPLIKHLSRSHTNAYRQLQLSSLILKIVVVTFMPPLLRIMMMVQRFQVLHKNADSLLAGSCVRITRIRRAAHMISFGQY
ncbi:hypothetical protein DPX16_5110 [Anabarilius grahami]|uniref:Uncharacterized protein n=1 Tax=Anabarilius grahami TaxID=495550 RepID=A0A3N0XKY1_ANAGA|nr:hypothetical protein DPX16_5110 [Anabarilius grahami]